MSSEKNDSPEKVEQDSAGKAAPSAKKGGIRLGGFELISKVGRGGMGTVYKARQIALDRIVAVKILAPHLAESSSFVRRFAREAKAVARLNHPNIVQGIDAGEADGYYYFAMEFVDGETLHRLLTREGILDEKRALEIVRDVARALGHAHRAQIVHRDIKPGNIMFTRTGVTKLCDLGLARLSKKEIGGKRRQTAIGTPYYMSPEQAKGIDDVDIRSDIYSLGATLYRMVVGEPPFTGPSPSIILNKHINEPVPWPKEKNPRLSDHICHIICKMLAKNPEERYQTPEELERDVQLLLEGKPPAALEFQIEGVHTEVSEEEAKQLDARLQRKREALKAFSEIRQAIRAVAKEQNVAERDVIDLLRGNLDETKADTFLKYALILISDHRFARAKQEVRNAQRLGADVSGYIDRLNALAAPSGMVYVPAGEFIFGPPENQTTKETKAFYISVTPVTNAEYFRFTRATGRPVPSHWVNGKPPEGQEEYPVVNVTWDDAQAYARWARQRLPTELEWEKAARGVDGRIWPWGNVFDPALTNTAESQLNGPVPVGERRGISPYGCLCMAGNVREWTADAAQESNGQNDLKVVRGACWKDDQQMARTFVRRTAPRGQASPECGFRCARDA